MNHSYWLIVIFGAAVFGSGCCRPQDDSRGSTAADSVIGLQSGNGAKSIESIAVVARASNDHPMPKADSVMQMDIRTPPKLMEMMQGKVGGDVGRRRMDGVDRIEANGRFELPDVSERGSSMPFIASEGKKKKEENQGMKGIAVPVFMDDVEEESPPKKAQKTEVKPKEEKKKTGKPIIDPTTTPSSGLSTWILLSDNREISTNPPKKLAVGSRKEPVAKPVTTTRKPVKIQTTTVKPVKEIKTDTPKMSPIPKKTTPRPDMSALEVMVKNQKKAAATTPKIEEVTLATRLPVKKPATKPTRINDRMDPSETDRPSTTMLMVTQNPTTVVAVDQQTTEQATTDPTVETTTKKKKNGGKKKKKNKNRRRKPGNSTEIEQKNVVKNPNQPVSAQFYNFLSREIMPTVGLGLVGVLVTAGLAGLLGYNPFLAGNLPVRRTYEVHHGYTPNGYYNYNTDYSDGGQSEEALFREVLSGMPEGSKYGLSNSETSYAESQIYKSQDQVYDSMKDKTGETFTYPEKKNDEEQNYGGTYYDRQDAKYPVYNREVSASYVYPETSTKSSDDYGRTPTVDSGNYQTNKLSSKYYVSKTGTIERQPEALYRVAGDYDAQYRGDTVQGVSTQHSWHRIGSAMDYRKFSHLEPGPRSLNLTEVAKKRTKRDADTRVARKESTVEKDVENEIDFDQDQLTTTENSKNVTIATEADYDVIEPNPAYNVLEVLKRLAQYKLKMGLSFLRSTTDAFSRYLDVIQKRVDESFSNATLVHRVRRSDRNNGKKRGKNRGRRRRRRTTNDRLPVAL